MQDIYKRYILFLGGCILTRSLLAYTAYKIPTKYLPWMGVGAIIFAFSLLRIYFFAPRDTGPEVFGGKIWWNKWRLVHAMMYILFAYFAFSKDSEFAWKVLAVDVLIGLTAFLQYHSTRMDLK